jgi:hypothetical protein
VTLSNPGSSDHTSMPGGPAAGRPSPPALLLLWALAGGLAAGLVAALCGEALYGWFQPVLARPPDWDKISAFDKPDILSGLLRRETPTVEAKNAALAYGLLGATLGAALGLAAGLARRSRTAALTAALVGVVAGAATGAVMSAALIPVFFRALNPESGMLLGLLIHAGIWVPIGAAAGLAFGVGLGGRRSIPLALMGGLAGAALGTLIFEIANGLVFPSVRLDKPIPGEAQSRILSYFCVTVFTALGAALGVGERRAKAGRAAESG